MDEKDGAKSEERWRRLPNLREDIFQIWQKPDGELNPSSIIATTESDGAPHVANVTDQFISQSLTLYLKALLSEVIYYRLPIAPNLRRNRPVKDCFKSIAASGHSSWQQ